MIVYFLLFCVLLCSPIFFFFFFNDTATTEIYTLSLHDALPILKNKTTVKMSTKKKPPCVDAKRNPLPGSVIIDRKSTRLNSSHQIISYAVFCLKKKNSE